MTTAIVHPKEMYMQPALHCFEHLLRGVVATPCIEQALTVARTLAQGADFLNECALQFGESNEPVNLLQMRNGLQNGIAHLHQPSIMLLLYKCYQAERRILLSMN